MAKCRFQDLEIWKMSIEIADKLFDIADEVEQKKLYRFSEQLRGTGLSMSNISPKVPVPILKKNLRIF